MKPYLIILLVAVSVAVIHYWAGPWPESIVQVPIILVFFLAIIFGRKKKERRS
jgi:Flp pilus assembly protein TadB